MDICLIPKSKDNSAFKECSDKEVYIELAEMLNRACEIHDLRKSEAVKRTKNEL